MKKLSFALLAVLAVAGPATAIDLARSGFETSEGFAPGPLDLQNGWNAATGYNVVNNFARTGTQSVQWSGTDGTWAWTDVLPPYTGGQAVTGETWVYIVPQTSDERVFGIGLWGYETGTTGYQMIGGASLNSSGQVRAGGDWGTLYDDSSIVGSVGNPVGRWIQLMIHYTPGASNANVMVDGQMFNITVAPTLGIADLDLYADWRNSNDPGTGYYDDYSLTAVPEPATMAAVGMGLALIARRRRRA